MWAFDEHLADLRSQTPARIAWVIIRRTYRKAAVGPGQQVNP